MLDRLGLHDTAFDGLSTGVASMTRKIGDHERMLGGHDRRIARLEGSAAGGGRNRGPGYTYSTATGGGDTRTEVGPRGSVAFNLPEEPALGNL
jgi:hypothetical protein